MDSDHNIHRIDFQPLSHFIAYVVSTFTPHTSSILLWTKSRKTASVCRIQTTTYIVSAFTRCHTSSIMELPRFICQFFATPNINIQHNHTSKRTLEPQLLRSWHELSCFAPRLSRQATIPNLTRSDLHLSNAWVIVILIRSDPIQTSIRSAFPRPGGAFFVNQARTRPKCLSSADLEYIHGNAFAYTCKTPTHLDPFNSDSKPLFPNNVGNTGIYDADYIIQLWNRPPHIHSVYHQWTSLFRIQQRQYVCLQNPYRVGYVMINVSPPTLEICCHWLNYYLFLWEDVFVAVIAMSRKKP